MPAPAGSWLRSTTVTAVAALALLLGAPAGAAVPPPAQPTTVIAVTVPTVPPVPVGPVATPPVPDPAVGSEQLRRDLAALTAQVEQLDVQAEVAAEAWNEVRAELDSLLVEEVRAQGDLADAGRSLDEDTAAATRRVRALYRSGGGVELAWTALSGPGFAQAASTFRTARVVISADAAAVERARDQVDVAVTSSGRVQQLRRDRAALEAEAEQRHREAEAALAARQDLLRGTDAALVAAVQREREEAERAALAAAAAQAQAAADAAIVAQQSGAITTSGISDQLSPEARAQIAALGGPGTVGPGGGTVTPGTVGADQQAVVDRAAASAPTPAAAHAIRAAATRLGLPYVWGATGPSTFDCSGLTGWAYRQAGVNLPRTSRQQYAALPKVPVDALLPGDLVFYANGSAPSSIHHVSIYLGDGLILTAPRTGDVVKISPLWKKPLYGAVRPAG